MSQDIRIFNSCPHTIIEESAALSDDRRHIIPRMPISGNSTVVIQLDDQENLRIPQTGLTSSAQLYGTKKAPFNINRNENELVLKIGSISYNVALPVGKRISLKSVFDVLANSSAPVLYGDYNSSLVISDASRSGISSHISIGGTAADALGFSEARGVRGRIICPSWDLVKNNSGALKIRFSSKIKTNHNIKLSYVALSSQCLRCGGSLVENDLQYNAQGQLYLISDENLLYQAASKIILTQRGSNFYHPNYGTNLLSYVGSKAISSIAGLIGEEVRRALRSMQGQQRQQGKYQAVSSKEQLYSIDAVNANIDPSNPTAVEVSVRIRNSSNEPVNLTLFFTVPQATNLNNVLSSQARFGTP